MRDKQKIIEDDFKYLKLEYVCFFMLVSTIPMEKLRKHDLYRHSMRNDEGVFYFDKNKEYYRTGSIDAAHKYRKEKYGSIDLLENKIERIVIEKDYIYVLLGDDVKKMEHPMSDKQNWI